MKTGDDNGAGNAIAYLQYSQYNIHSETEYHVEKVIKDGRGTMTEVERVTCSR